MITEAGAISAHERREMIVRLVDEDQRVSVADLTDRFGVTDASIRRDLVLLGLLLGRIGNVQAALHLLLLLDPFDHDAVIERTNFHKTHLH